MFCQKLTGIIQKKRNHYFVWEEIILFSSWTLEKIQQQKKSLQMNWFAFSQNILPIVANPSAHILVQVVFLCISTSVAQFDIIFWFLV
jgi:hypothetical protein